jgi:hypothetical protein
MSDHAKSDAAAQSHREDPWRHRAQGMRCGSCMWFVAKVMPEVPGVLLRKSPLGRCRRHAPIAGGHGWPAVFEADWCGDHKLDEAAAT